MRETGVGVGEHPESRKRSRRGGHLRVLGDRSFKQRERVATLNVEEDRRETRVCWFPQVMVDIILCWSFRRAMGGRTARRRCGEQVQAGVRNPFSGSLATPRGLREDFP